MSEPLVCAVMLTKDRSEMAARAVRAFREQTYPNAQLFVLDTGEKCARGTPYGEPLATTVWMPEQGRLNRSIGQLRNGALRCALGYFTFDVVVTWDDDDVSHPHRIAEQVAHLQASGADVVGYNELLFWRDPISMSDRYERPGEAWLWKYASGRPGSSFCYKRSTWELKPFPDLPKNAEGSGEDVRWALGLKVELVSSLNPEPRLLCSIHAGNSQSYDELIRKSENWKRAPEWDLYCQEKMKGNYIHDYLGQGEE